MSETDSFIDEVSEEVRRDQLYGVFRKYGWIAISLVLLIVGAAGFNEWRKAQTASQSQATGDQILAALEAADPGERVARLEQLSFETQQKQALLKLQTAAMLVEEGRIEEAGVVYENVAALSEVSTTYTDLAKLKIVMIQPEKNGVQTLIEELTGFDRPYRLLAIEQRALASVRSQDKAAAIEDLNLIVQDALATQDLRERAQQLIVVLGGDLPQIPSLLPVEGDG